MLKTDATLTLAAHDFSAGIAGCAIIIATWPKTAPAQRQRHLVDASA